MNNLDKQYQNLLQDLLDNGVKKKDRTGTGTLSVFGRQIRHSMKDGFPMLTTKKLHWPSITTELVWFLKGDTNIKYLLDNGCNIWNGDAYKNYLKWAGNNPLIIEEFIEKIKRDSDFSSVYGELGPIYGKQWRRWTNIYPTSFPRPEPYQINQIDQIANLINDLKTNPDSRRLMVNAWNVGELDQMVLPPCHYGFQVYTRELSHDERYNEHFKRFKDRCTPECYTKEDFDNRGIPTRAISLMWNQRSVDTFLGLPFNIASYGLLLEIIAKAVNMVPDELIGNLGDTHLYSNHIEQAKEQIGRLYTPEERHELLKTAMGDFYQTAVDEQVPFGGGLSEYYEANKIPYHSREPFELPKLKLSKTDDFWNGFDVSLFGHLDPTDFQIENYKSHPSIKAPLSN
jgi:thymidylate synthase